MLADPLMDGLSESKALPVQVAEVDRLGDALPDAVRDWLGVVLVLAEHVTLTLEDIDNEPLCDAIVDWRDVGKMLGFVLSDGVIVMLVVGKGL